MPQGKQQDSDGEGQGGSEDRVGGGIVIKVTHDHDNDSEEDLVEQQPLARGQDKTPIGVTGNTANGTVAEGRNPAPDSNKEPTAATVDSHGREGRKAGRAKRKRPAHRWGWPTQFVYPRCGRSKPCEVVDLLEVDLESQYLA